MTYKTKFIELVDAIITNIKRRKTEDSLRFGYNGAGYDLHDRSARIELIRSITDDYVTNHGELPDAAELERLADAILDEELTDQSSRKIANVEYPHQNAGQRKRRSLREVPLYLVEADIPTYSVTLTVYESVDERIKRKISQESAYYTALNSAQPVIVRKATADELARVIPSPKYTRSREHYEWSMDVRRRDSFTCQKCGSDKGRMHAHHIEAYATALDLRYDLNNGTTLCAACHFEFHDIYGYGGNTRSQFNEWIGGDYYEL